MNATTAVRSSRQARRISKLVRGELGLAGSPHPIEFVDGFDAPATTGSRGGHFTRGGSRIYHPSAYSKRGWSNMVYRCSTLRITVGAGWVLERLLAEESRIEAARRSREETWEAVRNGVRDPSILRFDSEGKIVDPERN